MTDMSKRTTGDRLIIGFVLVILLYITMGIISNVKMRTLSNLTRNLYRHPLVVSNAALAANVEIIKIHRSMKDLALLETPSAIDSAIAAVNRSERDVYQQLDIVSENILGGAGQLLVKEARDLANNWKEMRSEVIQLVRDGNREKAAAITMGKGARHVAALERKSLEMTSYARRKADGFMKNADLAYSITNRTSIFLIVIGALLSILVAVFTIRKVRASENIVGEHLALINSVIDGVGDPIYVKNTTKRLILANNATGKAWGQDPQKILGKSNDEVLPAESADKTNKVDDAVIRTGNPYSFEEKFETAEGIQTYLSLKTPLRAVSGEIIGIIGISRNITDRKAAEEQIAASLKEKEVLLREVHHRVKNNLQIISSLLNLQTASCGSQTESQMLRESKSRINVMASVHEKLYQSGNLAEVMFYNYIRSFVQDLFHLYGVKMDRVRLALTQSDIRLDIERAIPCGLIINELISNSLKYAFPNEREGCIMVSLRKSKKNDSLVLCVGDDGIGLPDDFVWDNVQSLGLRLVHILAHDQLEGDVEIDRSNGTLFRIQFMHRHKE